MSQTPTYQIRRWLTESDKNRLQYYQKKLETLVKTFHNDLSVTIGPCNSRPERADYSQIKADNQIIAVIASKSMEILVQNLLKEQKNCVTYQTCSSTIIRQSMGVLGESEYIEIEDCPALPDWFYHNAPTQMICFTFNQSILAKIYINPLWITQTMMPLKLKKQAALTSLVRLLKHQTATLTAKLTGNKMTLNQLHSLQNGDVVLLDNQTDAPLHLFCQQQVFATAKLGCTLTQKAIQIIGDIHD